MVKQKKLIRKVEMTNGKRNIIRMLRNIGSIFSNIFSYFTSCLVIFK